MIKYSQVARMTNGKEGRMEEKVHGILRGEGWGEQGR